MNSITNKYFEKIFSLKQKKYREKYSLFIAEGEHLAEEILKSDIYSDYIDSIILSSEYKNEDLISKFKNQNIYILENKKFNKLADTINPQGILIVCREPEFDNLNFDNIVVGLDNISDPGNTGTILRTCHWFNIKHIYASTNTCEFYNPKVIRASQGAIFHLAFKENINLEKEILIMNELGYEIILTDLDGDDIRNFKINKDKKYFIIFGNEANGISKSIKQSEFAKKLKISSFNNAESLNVSVSAGIILYHFTNKMY